MPTNPAEPLAGMYTSPGGEVTGGEVMLGEKQANILKSWHFVGFLWVKKKSK